MCSLGVLYQYQLTSDNLTDNRLQSTFIDFLLVGNKLNDEIPRKETEKHVFLLFWIKDKEVTNRN